MIALFDPGREALAGLAVALRPGEHRLACPRCAEAKPRRRDDALALRVEPDGGLVWLCHRCGWKGGRPAPEVRATARNRRVERLLEGGRTSVRAEASRASTSSLAPAARLEEALARWRRARPIERGTVAWRYLEEARGLPIAAIADRLAEGDLRWSPEEAHPSGWRGPALLALVTDAVEATPRTLHRTWLAPDGSGKAPIERPRLLWPGLGKRGGCVRLFADAEVSLALGLAEGIETALALALAGPVPSWAALDAGNLAAFPVLDGIEALWIAADHDPAGLAAAASVRARWHAAGREVLTVRSRAAGADLADLAGRARHAG